MKSSEKITIAVSIFAICFSAISLYIAVYETWLAPTFSDFITRGSKYLDEGDYHLARRCFEQALEIRPCDSNALRDKGYALINLGIDNEDIKIAHPGHAREFLEYYRRQENQITRENLDYFDQAFQCFVAAKESRPDCPEMTFYRCALSFYLPTGPESIRCFTETINTIEAVWGNYKKNCMISKLKSDAWYGISIAYEKMGQEEEAKRALNSCKEAEKELCY